jgi:hypothetical protein
MKTRLFTLHVALSMSSAMAQFAWDEEPLADPVQAAVDRIDDAVRTPFIEASSPAYIPTFNPPPVTPPAAVPVFQPFVSPVVDVDPLVEQCDLEPAVAQVYRKAEIADDEDCPEYIGRLSANPYAVDSTANPYSPAGSPYSSTSVNNRFGPYGSPFSSTSARNPYATDAPDIVAEDGTYLGKLSDNRYDPDSVSNPYGRYGSPYSSTSINNPYSTYGSPYSSQSPNNPYATQAPLLFGD